MFAYCNNNPVNLSDHSGMIPFSDGFFDEDFRILGEWISRWITGNGYDASADGTLTLGITGSLMGGAGGSASLGITADHKGNVGMTLTLAGGGGFPYAGYSGFANITSAPTIYEQTGQSVFTGGSLNVMGGSLGGEYQTFKDSKTGAAYHGGTLLLGSAASFPAEWHGEAGHTWMLFSFNVRDAWRNMVNWIAGG
jgi:hypothetical protein